MSEPDLPIGFNRMNRLRQSLPLARSSSQAKLRAPGQISTLSTSAPPHVFNHSYVGQWAACNEMRNESSC